MQHKHHSNGETLRRLPNIHHLSSLLGFLHTTTLIHPISPLLPSTPSQLTRLNPLPLRPAPPPPPRPPSSHHLNPPPLHRRIHGRTRPTGSAPASGHPRAPTPRAPPPRTSEPSCPAHSSTGWPPSHGISASSAPPEIPPPQIRAIDVDRPPGQRGGDDGGRIDVGPRI
jgi:hypothetical protein